MFASFSPEVSASEETLTRYNIVVPALLAALALRPPPGAYFPSLKIKTACNPEIAGR
jgi:hypothetical protein